MSDRWTPGIGDPTPVGWLTVVAYLVAALMCALVASRRPQSSGNRHLYLLFWGGTAALMLALGINKQLDLQSLFTQLMRDLAKAYGLYDQRRVLQVVFILAIALSGSIGMALVLRRISLLQRNMLRAILGLIFVYTYVLIRAASFHHIDRFISQRILGLRWNWIMELGGVAVVFHAALREWRAGASSQNRLR